MTKLMRFPHPFFSGRENWKWFILVTVLIGATMSALDVSIVNIAMPTLNTEFNVSMSVIEWVAMAYMLTLTIFLPFFGRLADMFGRTRLYSAGFIVFTLGSFFCGMAPTASFLIGARVLQAVGAGLLQANSVAIITDAFPSTERGKAIGIQGAVQAISMCIGPLVGGLLIAAIGWRAIFYVNLPIGFLGVVAALLILPKSEKSGKKEKVDFLGTLTFVLGLGFLVLAVNELSSLGWGSPTVISYFVLSVVFLASFVITELKVEHPLIDLKLFRNDTFLIGNITGMFSYYVLFAMLFLMPFYLEKVLNVSVALAGALLTPIPLAMAVVAPFSGHISDKYGSRIMTTSGMAVSALTCLALLFLSPTTSLWVLVIELVALGLGMGMFTPPNNSAIMGAAPPDKLGVAGGILNMTRSLGLIFGVDISGVIFTSLEHRYIVDKGYQDVQHIFGNNGIPLADKDNAFMRGFLFMIVVLLIINLTAALLSARKKEGVELSSEAIKEWEGI